MKECWQKVITAWANVLQLTEKPILEISDLINGTFFIKLLEQLGEEFDESLDKTIVVHKFIEDNFTSVKVNSEWDNNEVTIIGSLFLLVSSLECSHLRVPLYGLDTCVQLNIQAFIQRFLSFPKTFITRQLLNEVVETIESTQYKECELQEPSSFICSPNTSLPGLNTPPEIKVANLSKFKQLKSQVDILNMDKLHLQEELEATKKELTQLVSKCISKDQEILHLNNELFILRSNYSSDENNAKLRVAQKELEDFNQLKDDLAVIQAALCISRSELEVALNDNQELREKLEKSQLEKQQFEKKYEENDLKLGTMYTNMELMNYKLTILKQKCQEQEEVIRERICNKISDESIITIDDSVINIGETLASVIDVKYAELEEENKKLREQLAESENTVLNLQTLQEIIKSKVKSEDDCSIIKSDRNEVLDKINEFSQLKEDIRPVIITKNLHLNQLRCNIKSEQQEIDRLNDILDAKTIRLEESTALSEKLRRDLTEKECEIKTATSNLKFALFESEHLKNELILSRTEIEVLNKQIETVDRKLLEKEDRIAAVTTEIGERMCESENLREQITKLEQNLATYSINMQNKNTELSEVRLTLEKFKNDLECAKSELCAKASVVAELQHDVQMCQHEKSVLEKQIGCLIKDLEKNESLIKDIKKYEAQINLLEKELEKEKANMKIVQDQVELEDKLNNAFDAKLSELQIKMKLQYEKELTSSIDEYKDKINQLRLKIAKDKLHIQELSADLWNTTDKLLLSQQQVEALRNQLRRTKCALEILSNSAIRRHSLTTSDAIQRASNPCLWMQAEEGDPNPIPFYEDPLYKIRRKGLSTFSKNNVNFDDERKRTYSLTSNVNSPQEEEDEVFNDAFMQDLKDGICRLSEDNRMHRASCPPITRITESPINMERANNDKQVLIPPDKPKRKGQIAYSKPGPPTPCRTVGARLSLQNGDKLESKKLRENNPIHLPPPTMTGKFSKLFSSSKGHYKTKSLNQDSPKAKKKNFFQRKFGSNRENVPP